MTKNTGSVGAAMHRLELRADSRLSEAARIAEVKAQGFVPLECGPEIPAAPARGRVGVFEATALYPKGESDFEMKPAGYMGRKTLQIADVFDVMNAQAARRKVDQPFNPSQIAMARFYRNLVEKHAVAGVRCSSLESIGGGSGGGGGEYIDAVLRDRDRIELIRGRIGDRSAMVVRRIRPSKRGSRVSIFDRMLVDSVCLKDQTIGQVLRAHGWSVQGRPIKALLVALADSLDRMMGPVRGGSLSACRFGDGPGSIWQ